MTPWEMKTLIDEALEVADRNGFRIDRAPYGYNPNVLALYTKGANEHGFADDMVLMQLNDWREVLAFFAGWEKRGMIERAKG